MIWTLKESCLCKYASLKAKEAWWAAASTVKQRGEKNKKSSFWRTSLLSILRSTCLTWLQLVGQAALGSWERRCKAGTRRCMVLLDNLSWSANTDKKAAGARKYGAHSEDYNAEAEERKRERTKKKTAYTVNKQQNTKIFCHTSVLERFRFFPVSGVRKLIDVCTHE